MNAQIKATKGKNSNLVIDNRTPVPEITAYWIEMIANMIENQLLKEGCN